MVGRLEFHVPGKFDSFKQNKKTQLLCFLEVLVTLQRKQKQVQLEANCPGLEVASHPIQVGTLPARAS